MPLILTTAGMLSGLDRLTSGWVGARSMGLMMGTVAPLRSWTTANVVPAVFGGYGGTQPITNWQAAVLTGELATTKATEIVWAHTGAPGSCLITGYYVIDALDVLQWAELFAEPWMSMALVTDRFRVTPAFALGSRYPSV